MAAYSGTPTVLSAWEQGDRHGKRIRVIRRLSLVLDTQGGLTNNIPAATLGLISIQRADPVLFTDAASKKRAVWCFTDGSYLYIGNPIEATDADRGEPIDVTGTLVVEVSGIPSVT